MRKQVERLLVVMMLLVAVAAGFPARALGATVAGAATANGPAAGVTGRYPVIFIPGIGGTELYNGNKLVWLSPADLVKSQVPVLNLFHMDDLLPLRLQANGATPYKAGVQIHLGDVMRSNVTDAYGGLINALKQQGYVEGKDLRLLPYDWRLSPDAARASLSALVDRTLAETGAAKVVLIGHSLGGLVARDYIVHGGAAKVKAMIGLATPWLGAPMAYKALAYGWDLGLKLPGTNWSAVPFDEVKLLVQNYPSVYALAPDHAFFDFYGGYLIRGGRMLSFDESEAQALAPHNRTLAVAYDGWSDQLLDGSDHGVMQFLMAGRGVTTLGGFTERKDWLGMTEQTAWNVDGDGVVPRYSADLGNSRNPALAGRYLGHLVGVAYANADHTLFTQSPAVQQTVVRWLAQVNR